jgi:hypothetical protein
MTDVQKFEIPETTSTGDAVLDENGEPVINVIYSRKVMPVEFLGDADE